MFLHNFVENPFTSKAKINYDKMKNTISTAVKFLDNIIDINNFPSPIYKNYQKSFRTIGLGVTGLADMLVMMNMKYNSPEAEKFIYDLMNFISLNAYLSSIELARTKGEFPFLDRDKFIQSGFLTKHVEKHKEWEEVINGIKQYGIRNSKILSVAPTGTISLTYGNNCSSGIEPIFSLSYDRKVKMGGQSDDNIKIVKMQDYAYELWLNTKEDNIVSKDKFITALEMTVNEHVDMLKNIAFHIDMSVSKTINVPTDYSFEDTKNIYLKCYDYGIKGCTIFRPNNIRQGILMSPEDSKKDKEKNDNINYDSIMPISRKSIGTTHGSTYCKKCACGTLYITINKDDNGNIVESFVHTSKGGICQANIGAINRMISLALRSGVKVDEIIDQLKGINCPACVKVKTKGEKIDGISCPDILARTLTEFVNVNNTIQSTKNIISVKKEKVKETNKTINTNNTNKCPDCGSEIRHEGGCVMCTECGWSKCE